MNKIESLLFNHLSYTHVHASNMYYSNPNKDYARHLIPNINYICS